MTPNTDELLRAISALKDVRNRIAARSPSAPIVAAFDEIIGLFHRDREAFIRFCAAYLARNSDLGRILVAGRSNTCGGRS